MFCGHTGQLSEGPREKLHFLLHTKAEAVIPTEANLCSARVAGFVPIKNDELMVKHLDLLE